MVNEFHTVLFGHIVSFFRSHSTFVGEFSIDSAIISVEVKKIVEDSESSGSQLKLATSQFI